MAQIRTNRRWAASTFPAAFSVACILLFTLASQARAATDQNLVSCPFSGSGGYNLTHGIFVTSYPGTNLDQVTLAYAAAGAGQYTITLIARSGTYDGPIIGTAATDVTLGASAASTPVTLTFGGKPVPQGSTVAFSQSFTGPGILQFDPGTGAPCPNVTLTNGTAPPLDTTLTHVVGLTIAQALPTQATGQRAAALKKCKKKHSARARRKCRKKANLLPV